MSRTYGRIRWVPPIKTRDGDGRPMWVIETRPDIIMKLKRFFPRADQSRRGALTITHAGDVARDVEMVLYRWPMEIKEDDLQRLQEAAAEDRERDDVILSLLQGNRPSLEGLRVPAREPYAYQAIGSDMILTTGGVLVADDLGLGKTMTGIMVLAAEDALPALIVCPTHLPKQWRDEIAMTFPMLTTHIVASGKVYDPSTSRALRGRDPDVLIMNYHKLAGWGTYLAGMIKTVGFDEAQELRRGDSEKYRAAEVVAAQANYRYGLTATPVYNYGGEMWNIMNVIAPDRLGSKQEFAREWCGGAGWSDKVRVEDPAALGEYLRDQGLMIRRTRKDVGRELPDVITIEQSTDIDQDVLDDMMEGVVDLAELILAADTDKKTRFTASGDIDWRMRLATGVAKAPYVAEFVKMLLESTEKVIIWVWHREVYSILMEALEDYNPVMYSGSESTYQKELSYARFMGGEYLHQARKNEARPWMLEESRVMLMSLRSGAGLNGLQKVCSVGVFAELDWAPGMHDQCVGRLHRDGMNDPVVAYYLRSDYGSDPVVGEVLFAKRQQSEPIRDPTIELFVEEPVDLDDQRSRVQKLAAEAIERRRRARR